MERVMKLGSIDRFLSYRLSPDAKLVAIQDAKTDRLEVLSVAAGKRVTLSILSPITWAKPPPTARGRRTSRRWPSRASSTPASRASSS